MKYFLLLLIFFSLVANIALSQTPIDRKALVERHTVVIKKVDTLASLSVGNGKFAFTTDVTGLQTFPEFYAKGVPLGTQSEWGWHSFPNPEKYVFQEALKDYTLNGRTVSYGVQVSEPARNKAAVNWLRQNPHRLQLGNLGFELYKKDGSKVAITDLKDIHQELNMWTGEIKSHFTIENVPVDVLTYSHQDNDQVAVRVQSDLLKQGRIKVRLRFPYPTGEFLDEGVNWQHPTTSTSSKLTSLLGRASIEHRLDSSRYFVELQWSGKATVAHTEAHTYILTPDPKSSAFEFGCYFSDPNRKLPKQLPIFAQTQANSQLGWKAFWSRGGAIDFEGSTDPRAHELERRVILSQYLTKIQCAGSYPPQETGLTYNSWFGKPHLEMYWWHGVHFALWGRIDLLEKSLDWYAKVADKAKTIAQRQGYQGIRWQKMTDHTGNEAPSSVGAFIIWQQPHFIYFAELAYRHHKNRATLDKYKDLVFATADFMASFAWFDKEKGKYILGKGLIPAQERFKPEDTFNPTYELAYWHWTLKTAQQWRERLNLPRNPQWDTVLANLSPLPQQNGVYLAAESAPDSYTNEVYMTDHPSVLGALGMLPTTEKVDMATMGQTFDLVWNKWVWKDTWGWDFPMAAMTATRLSKPEKAVDALLMNIRTNTYLPNGHNFQDERLRLYLPGNGGVLAAVAMMCAGYDGNTKRNPGIPQNGQWKVKWEGLTVMP